MKKHKALSSVIDGKVLKMFIVNAQAIIQKNYSLATFEKSASMLTGTTGVVLSRCWESPLRGRERGLGALLWRRFTSFFWCVRSLPVTVATLSVCVC